MRINRPSPGSEKDIKPVVAWKELIVPRLLRHFRSHSLADTVHVSHREKAIQGSD